MRLSQENIISQIMLPISKRLQELGCSFMASLLGKANQGRTYLSSGRVGEM